MINHRLFHSTRKSTRIAWTVYFRCNSQDSHEWVVNAIQGASLVQLCSASTPGMSWSHQTPNFSFKEWRGVPFPKHPCHLFCVHSPSSVQVHRLGPSCPGIQLCEAIWRLKEINREMKINIFVVKGGIVCYRHSATGISVCLAFQWLINIAWDKYFGAW